jgi:arylsulfatase A-like enzyme
MPTLLDMAGVGIPDGLDGRSVYPAIKEGKEPENKPVLAEIYGEKPRRSSESDTSWMAARLMIRDTRWKYIMNRFGMDELYDLEGDPDEMTNLADMPGYSSTVREMRRKAAGAIQKTGPGPYAWCLDS